MRRCKGLREDKGWGRMLRPKSQYVLRGGGMSRLVFRRPTGLPDSLPCNPPTRADDLSERTGAGAWRSILPCRSEKGEASLRRTHSQPDGSLP